MSRLRDRFEKQEFLAIMIPAMMPPPTPVKLFEFAAGVFEMKALWFFSRDLRREVRTIFDLGPDHDYLWASDSAYDVRI